VAAVRDFKAALGLSDQDAAGVHMEVGRRIFRSRMEQGDKSAEGAESAPRSPPRPPLTRPPSERSPRVPEARLRL